MDRFHVHPPFLPVGPPHGVQHGLHGWGRAARLIGAAVSYAATGGGSDANVINGKGIPTAVLGVGYEEIHSTRERMPLDQLELLAEWALAIITA